METVFLSVDLGGTSLRIAVLRESGEILEQKGLSSDLVRKPEELVATLTSELGKIPRDLRFSEFKIAGVAMGIPGLVQGNQGTVFESPHFPLWRDFHLKTLLQPKLPFPIFMENDANLAALGEGWLGAGKDWRDFIMLTLGTGVGGGIINEGKIFHGPHGFAGEIGHITIDRHGLAGALGIQGTLESFTSLSGLKLQIKYLQTEVKKNSQGFDWDKINLNSPKLPEELAELARKGNHSAQSIWKEFGKNLACGIASLANTLGIFNFIIGGGLAGAWDLFYKPCMEEIPRRIYQTTAKLIIIVPARLGNQAALLGGVALIRQNKNQN